MKNLVVFGLNGSNQFAKKVCDHLDVRLATATEKQFEDDESYSKSDVNVRDADCYVIAGLFSDSHQKVNEKLVNLLWFIGSLRDASARRITAVIPYMGYARQDRKTESRAPITTKYMAQVLEAVGVNRILSVDVHSLSAFQNSFRIPADNLDPTRLYVDYLTGVDNNGDKIDNHIDDPLHEDAKNLVVLSPDIGGISRCSNFQGALEKRLGVDIPLAIFDKRRVAQDVDPSDPLKRSVIKGSRIIGNVKNKRVIAYDDLTQTGSTIAKAIEAAQNEGGKIYGVVITHGQFTVASEAVLENVDPLIITDTVPPWRVSQTFRDRWKVIPTAKLIAQAIKRTHTGGSISELLEVKS